VKYFIIHVVFLLLVNITGAQTPVDTAIASQHAVKKIKLHIAKKDTAISTRMDSVSKLSVGSPDVEAVFKTREPFSYRTVLKINPYYNFFASVESRLSGEHVFAGKEALFYLLAGLLLFFALVKLLFNKYVSNLLGLMFRGSLRQKQLREQLLQTPLPSLLLNIFFVIVGGLYIFFLIRYYNFILHTPFWLQLLYCIVLVAVVYLVKFVILKLTGWIFNMRDAADTYIFIVFLVNKLLAIFLLPLLIMMVFSLVSWTGVLLTLSYVMLGTFFAYRYIVSFAPVRREVKVSQFHFFMYLCAFEIIPLLLMYKILLHFFS
jgi:hypothetical protein